MSRLSSLDIILDLAKWCSILCWCSALPLESSQSKAEHCKTLGPWLG